MGCKKPTIEDIYRSTGSLRKAAALTGIPFTTLRRKLGLLNDRRETTPDHNTPPQTPATPEDRRDVQTADARTVEFTSPKRIVTVEDAVAFAEIDLTQWYVDRFEVTSWEQGLKLKREGRDDEAHRQTLWRVSLKLKRVPIKPHLDAIKAVIAEIEASPARPVRTVKALEGDRLLVLDLPDAHFGKLAWKPEVGGNYDLEIAARVFRDASLRLLEFAKPYAPREILIPFGNDFFHVDSRHNATFAGTPQDVDGRFSKMVRVGFRSMIELIDAASAVAPVTVLWVPGNHDTTTSELVTLSLAAWFRDAENVWVDDSPGPRKYFSFGVNLLGFTHGDAEKLESLPFIMLRERREDISHAKNMEWHVGHRHHKKTIKWLTDHDGDACVVRQLRSLSANDAWHHRQGYVNNRRAAEAFLYDERDGFVASFMSYAREE